MYRKSENVKLINGTVLYKEYWCNANYNKGKKKEDCKSELPLTGKRRKVKEFD